jgi:hypothetical protein
VKHPLHLVAAATLTLVGVGGFATIASAGTKSSTITVQSACSSGTVCTSFDLEVINGNNNIINGLTIEVVGQKIIHFQLTGYRSDLCKPTGVKNAIGCYPLKVPAKATLLGTGTTSGDLTKATKYTVYTTVDGFASAAGQDVYATNYSVTTPTSSTATGSTPVTSSGGGGTGGVIALGAGLLVLAALAYWQLVVRRKPDAGPEVVVASPNATTAPPDCSKAEAEVAAAEAMVKEVAQRADEHYHKLGALTVEGAVHGFIDESGDELENEIAQDSESAQWRLERAQAALQACREGRSPDGVGGDGFEPVPPSASGGDESDGPARVEIG